jgi:hypothetical protein
MTRFDGWVCFFFLLFFDRRILGYDLGDDSGSRSDNRRHLETSEKEFRRYDHVYEVEPESRFLFLLASY